MLDTVFGYCEKENLIEQKDGVLVGVSGGADSVCLLLVLRELQKKKEFSLQAVHVEHGIRGAESDADAEFVRSLCERLEVPLQEYHVDAVSYAKEKKLGLEEAARELRYDCYQKAARHIRAGFDSVEKQGVVKIALAHHADDNAETMLFQMIRGSGLDGLGGMQPKRELAEGMEVIRPMLKVTRKEIEAYLTQTEQVYCIDSSNADEAYSRNKIRHSVLPVLSEVNAQAIAHMNQSAEYLRELNVYISQQVAMCALEVLRGTEEGIYILKEPFEKLPGILRTELVHLALVKAAGVAKDIGANHIKLVEELFSLQVGRGLDLPYGLVAKRCYEGVLVSKSEEETGAGFFFSIDKAVLEEKLAAGSYEVQIPNGRLAFSLFENTTKTGEILKNTYTKWLDYDKIKDSFQIRTKRTGDYLIIDDAGHKKSLKEYFVNEKVPGPQREKVLLLTDENKVLWTIGYRISADVKISDQTKRILEIRMTGGKLDEN